MRVATNSFTTSLMDQLNSLGARQNRLQTQAATGQRLQSIADDPEAARRILDTQADSLAIAQFQRNVNTLQGTATASYSAIQSVKKVSDRAGEIATLADGTKSPGQLQNYAAELDQLIQQAAQSLNAKGQGGYLFGGTSNRQPPFVVSRDASGLVTSVTYQGDASTLEAEVGQGALVAASVPGANTTGSGPRGLVTDSRTGADLFVHLISLRQHLTSGDTAAIATTDHPALAKDEDNIIYHLANNGATQARLQAAQASLTAQSQAVTAAISHDGDADMAQTLVQLNQVQTAYRAAIQSGASIMGHSLMDYLR